MLERIRMAIAGWARGAASLLQLGADSLVGAKLPSARAPSGDESGGDWGLISGGGGPADRQWVAIRQDLGDALEAWRLNAWVRQVVRLCTAYVVGDGIKVDSDRVSVSRWLGKFWSHRQNRIDQRLAAWCDELTRSGELFIALFPNKVDGMQYVRAIPASQIQRVETDPEDYEREIGYWELVPGRIEPKEWKSVETAKADEPCLLHYAVNKPVGATRGESDLIPLLPWAQRYTGWLRDRVRFNKVRSELAAAEIIVDDDSQLEKKRAQYAASPPTAGSIFVHGRGEELKFPAAHIAGFEADADGRAMRLAMATSADVPLHFFSEGDSANRATAVEMGDPTHRFYRQRQGKLAGFLVDLAEVAYRRHLAILRGEMERGLGSWRRKGSLEIEAEVPDISRADNKLMAEAARTIVEAFATMKVQGWISDELAVRLSFKFAGELLTEDEVKSILEQGVEDEQNGKSANQQIGESGNTCPTTGADGQLSGAAAFEYAPGNGSPPL